MKWKVKGEVMEMHQSPAYRQCWACGLDRLSSNIHYVWMETGTKHGTIEVHVCVDCLNNIIDAYERKNSEEADKWQLDRHR